MALTLVKAAEYSDDPLTAGVIETFIYKDPIFDRLSFFDVPGNAYKYNRETTEDSAQWFSVNEPWTSTEQDVTPYTATLCILGSAVEIDDFLKSTRSNVNDLRAELMTAKTKAMKKEFMDTFFYGSATTNPKEFNGIHSLISSTTYNTVQVDSDDGANDALSLSDDLDAALDMIKDPFSPDIILSTKAMRRGVTKYLRGAGSINTGRDEFSRPCLLYNDIPWFTSDYITDTETTSSGAYSAKTGSATTSIFALSFADKAMQGIQLRGMEVVPWIPVPGTNKEEARIRWYCGIIMQSLVSCAKVVGIDVDGTVTV